MNKVEAIPYVKSRGLEFIDTFETLRDSLWDPHEDLEKYIERMNSLWREVQSLEIEENPLTIITVRQLVDWFFFPEGEPISFKKGIRGMEEDYNRLVVDLLYERSIGQCMSVEWTGSSVFVEYRLWERLQRRHRQDEARPPLLSPEQIEELRGCQIEVEDKGNYWLLYPSSFIGKSDDRWKANNALWIHKRRSIYKLFAFSEPRRTIRLPEGFKEKWRFVSMEIPANSIVEDLKRIFGEIDRLN